MVFTPRPIRPEGYCRGLCPSVRPSVCTSVHLWSVCPLPRLVRTITRKRIDGSSPNLHTWCILMTFKSLLILRGQGQRSRSPEFIRSKSLTGHISKTTGPIHSKQSSKCTATKGLSSHMPRFGIPLPVKKLARGQKSNLHFHMGSWAGPISIAWWWLVGSLCYLGYIPLLVIHIRNISLRW